MKLIDALYQVAYFCAFRILRIRWYLTRPKHHGALVLIWHEGQILLLRNSYHALWSLPGGGVDSGECAPAAAVREIREELGAEVAMTELRELTEITLPFRHRTDRVALFAWYPAARPVLLIDNREVVEARWFTVEEARRLALVPHLAHYLETRRGACGEMEWDARREADSAVRRGDMDDLSGQAAGTRAKQAASI